MVKVYWNKYRTIVFISVLFLFILFVTYQLLNKSGSNLMNLFQQVQGKGDNAGNVNEITEDSENLMLSKKLELLPASQYVHAFYYAWYGNPQFDGKYYHWNHKFLPHWKPLVSKKYATHQRHTPPDDIGSNFYPQLGPYSSRDPSILHKHMQYCVMAGIGVLALSWYPNGKADDEGRVADDLVTTILDIANEYKIKICFHIEPYHGRTAQSVVEDIKFLIENYQSHPAFYTTFRKRGDDAAIPFVYIYDSYLISPKDWSVVLKSNSGIRGTAYDAIVIGLVVEKRHMHEIQESGFDGFYTYFASSGFSYGSNIDHWAELAFGHDLIFVPSVGPGYVDTNIRPWNNVNTKERENGHYYEKYWSKALLCQTRFISITSFNEWHEGTQIEPAASGKSVFVEHFKGSRLPGEFDYDDYGKNPNLYLELTRKKVEKFSLLVK